MLQINIQIYRAAISCVNIAEYTSNCQKIYTYIYLLQTMNDTNQFKVQSEYLNPNSYFLLLAWYL